MLTSNGGSLNFGGARQSRRKHLCKLSFQLSTSVPKLLSRPGKCRVSEEGEPAIRARPARGRIGGRDELGHDLGRAAERRFVEHGQILADSMARVVGWLPPIAGRRVLAVGVRLDIDASTAKPWPPTSPFAMQRATVNSNSLRSRSLSRKRPCRFLEKVEWSGTAPSRSSRQNQR